MLVNCQTCDVGSLSAGVGFGFVDYVTENRDADVQVDLSAGPAERNERTWTLAFSGLGRFTARGPDTSSIAVLDISQKTDGAP